MIRHPLVVAILLGLVAGGCERPAGEGKNLVLVTLDTTRADHFGIYGDPEIRTPAFDRIARQGATFEHGISDVPITLPSHTTMFTGYPALGHGVRYNADLKVADTAETLAELLDEIGYETGAVVSTLVLNAKFGLDQGFDHYDDDLEPGYTKYDPTKYTEQDHWLPKGDRRAEVSVDRALAWLDDRARAPFFFWLHFYDAHYPYDPPPPWGRTHRDAYAAEIQYVDRELTRFVRQLEDQFPDAALIVTADHGEGLDDHREDGHGIFVYDETMRIPFAVRDSRIVPGTVVSAQVRTVDVAPTLLDFAGLGGESFGRGGSLVPVLTERGAPPDPRAYCESIKTKVFYGGSGIRALRTRDAKYILAPREELYDLQRDPGETQNLLTENRELAGPYRQELETLMREILEAGEPAVEPANADAATLATLRSLGYLSGSDGFDPHQTLEQELRLVGNDPKDLVDVSMSAQAIQNGYYDLAEKKLLRFFATMGRPEDNPRLYAAAHQNYAKVWMVRSEYGRAAEEFANALAADPTYDNARWSRVYALNLSGQSGLAVQESTEMLRDAPFAWRVRFHRAMALALTGETAEAARELAEVAEKGPDQETVTRSAHWYGARIGGPEEGAALEAYLQRS